MAGHVIAIDIRALAILRIGMGLILLWLLVDAYYLADVFYSDDGVLPRELNRRVLDGLGMSSAWTLYAMGGSVDFARTLMVFNGLAAIAMIAGFFTRWATVTALVLLWSLQMRNPLITTGGDVLLRMMLVWSVFLPMGAAASVDMMLFPRSRWTSTRVVSLGTAGLIGQLVCVYFFAGLAKLNADWFSGNAMAMSLQLEMYVKPLGHWLLGLPWLMKLMTWGTLIIEVGIIALVFSPVRTAFFRGLAAACFWILHGGVWLIMSIGIFSATCMLAWVALIPKASWPKSTMHWVRLRKTDRRRVAFEETPFAQWVTAGLLGYMILVNLLSAFPAVVEPRGLWGFRALGSALMVVQEFRMFGQAPRWNPQFNYDGVTVTEINAGLFGDIRRPKLEERSPYREMQNQAWRRYHWNLMELTDSVTTGGESVLAELKSRLLAYQVERWNQRHAADPIRSACLECVRAPIEVPPATTPEWRSALWATYERGEPRP